MLDMIIWIWLAVFLILVAMHLHANSRDIGMIAGVWMLFLGLFIAVTGLQMQIGYDTVVIGDNTSITYRYDDVLIPYTTYSYLWGLAFILIGLFMFIVNATSKWGNKG